MTCLENSDETPNVTVLEVLVHAGLGVRLISSVGYEGNACEGKQTVVSGKSNGEMAYSSLRSCRDRSLRCMPHIRMDRQRLCWNMEHGTPTVVETERLWHPAAKSFLLSPFIWLENLVGLSREKQSVGVGIWTRHSSILDQN